MEFPAAAIKRIVELIRGGNYSEHVMEFVALATQVIQYGISVLMGGGGGEPQSAGPPVEDAEGLCTALESVLSHDEGGEGYQAFPLDWKSIVTLLLTLVQTVVSSL